MFYYKNYEIDHRRHKIKVDKQQLHEHLKSKFDSLTKKQELEISDTTEFSRIPPEGLVQPDRTVRAGIAALASGALYYMFSLELLPDRGAGITNEVATLAIAGSFAVIASMQKLRSLCAGAEPSLKTKSLNIVGGAGAGTVGGVGTVPVLQSLMTLPFDGGLVALLSGMAGALFGHTMNVSTAEKSCQHCGALGDCNDVICKTCNLILFPAQVDLSDTDRPFLRWHEVASHFQSLGFTYNQSVDLAKKYVTQWGLQETKIGVVVSRDTFKNWVVDNPECIYL